MDSTDPLPPRVSDPCLTKHRSKKSKDPLSKLTGKFSDFSGVVLKAAAGGKLDDVDEPRRVALCLAAGASVNAVDHKGKTGLHRAAQAGHVRIMHLLINNGATVDQQDNKGEIPLF